MATGEGLITTVVFCGPATSIEDDLSVEEVLEVIKSLLVLSTFLEDFASEIKPRCVGGDVINVLVLSAESFASLADSVEPDTSDSASVVLSSSLLAFSASLLALADDCGI